MFVLSDLLIALPMILCCLFPASQCSADSAPAVTTQSGLWVTGYSLSDDSDTGRLPLSKLDLHALTHLIDFCNFPGPQGALDPKRTIPFKHSLEIVAACHAAGVKVMVSLGTDDGLVNIRQDISDQYRDTFIKTLVSFAVTRGYDGLDLDYEPIVDADVPNFTLFIQGLRAALDAQRPGMLLTVAAADQPAMYAKIQGCFNQINLMSYSLSGPWQGFKSWYNSNLYGDPYERMNNYEAYPSTDRMLQSYLDAGVDRSKLAIGVTFGGEIWRGISGPKQNIKGLTDADLDDADYREVMEKYYTLSRYHWDPIARCSYLSIVGKTPKQSIFISYEDDRTCVEKVAYARNNGLGGIMIWELGGGYCPWKPVGQQDVMLQAVKNAVLKTSTHSTQSGQ